MAKLNTTIAGDHLAALIRPRLAALASKAVLTGYPKLSVRIGEIAGRLGKLAKRGDAAGLSQDDKTVLASILAEAFAATGNPQAVTQPGDTIALTVNPPVALPAPQPLPHEQLTLTGGLAAGIVREGDTDDEGDGDGTLGSGKANLDIPWDRSPAKYEGLPVTLQLIVPSNADFIAVFNS